MVFIQVGLLGAQSRGEKGRGKEIWKDKYRLWSPYADDFHRQGTHLGITYIGERSIILKGSLEEQLNMNLSQG